MEQSQAVIQSVEPQDKLQPTKTLYDVSIGEVFLRNFMAGVGRAIGGIFIYFIFLLITVNLFITYVYPQIKPFIDEYQQAMKTINQINQTTKPGALQEAQQYLRDLQESLPR